MTNAFCGAVNSLRKEFPKGRVCKNSTQPFGKRGLNEVATTYVTPVAGTFRGVQIFLTEYQLAKGCCFLQVQLEALLYLKDNLTKSYTACNDSVKTLKVQKHPLRGCLLGSTTAKPEWRKFGSLY